MDRAERRSCGAATLGAACAGSVKHFSRGMFIPTFFGTPPPLLNNILGVCKDSRCVVLSNIECAEVDYHYHYYYYYY